MNLWTTLILLVLVAAGVVFWLVAPSRQLDLDDEPTSVQPETKYVFDPHPQESDLARLRFERRDKPAIVLEQTEPKDGAFGRGEWRMLEPVEASCESWVISSFVRFFSHAESARRFEPGDSDGVSAAEAGLEPPTAVVTLVDKKDAEFKLEIGGKVAMSDATYVRVAGQSTIHLVNRDFEPQLEKGVNDFRTKRVLPTLTNDAKKLEIKHDGRAYVFSRGDDDQWVVDSPVKDHADAAKIRTLLGKISNLRVVEFLEGTPEALSKYGFDRPFVEIRVTTETKRELPPEQPDPSTQPAEPTFETVTETYALAIGGGADLDLQNRFIRLIDEPWVGTILSSTATGVVPDLSQLRDPNVTRVKAADVTRLEYTTGGESAVLEKVDNQWQGTGDLSDLDAGAVAGLLQAVEDLKAIDYVDNPQDLSKLGLDPPRAVLKMTVAGSVTPITLRVGVKTESGLNAYAQLEGRDTVHVIPAAQSDQLVIAPISLRSREIFRFRSDEIREVDIQRGEIHYTLAREDEQWNMTEPAGAPVDPSGIREVTTDLSNLRAARVVGKGDDQAFGLNEPAVTIRFTVQKTPTPPPSTQSTQPASAPELSEHTLVVAQKNNTTYCRKDDDPYIFELDSTIFKVFTQEMIKRGLFEFVPADVVGFQVEAPGGTLDLTKEDGEWKYTPDPYVELSQKRVNDFVTELSKLRVDSWVKYNDADLDAGGLLNAPVTVIIRHKDDSTTTLKIGQEQPGQFPRTCGWVETKRVFRLRDADARKILRNLDDYIKSEIRETPTLPTFPTPP